MIYYYGDSPVPFTVMWTAEEGCFVDYCPAFGGMAICQRSAPGEGRPRFNNPHPNRQRQAMKEKLCDLCGKPLMDRPALSLSKFGGDYPQKAMLSQYEPLLHTDCARLSIAHCPELRRQLAEGEMRVRRTKKYAPRAVYATEAQRKQFIPKHRGEEPILALAVMDLLPGGWRDVTAEWI